MLQGTNKKAILFGLGFVAGASIYLLNRKKYSNFFGLFKKKTPFPNSVLFVGDSITAASGTYPTIIKRTFPNMFVDTVAKSGMTTDWMKNNLPSKLNRKWDRIYIYGGVNDAFNNVSQATTLNNIQYMVDLAIQNGATPYVMRGIEPSNYMDYRKMPVTRYVKRKEDYIPAIDRYKKLQDAISKSIKRATILPKFVISSSMTSDGIHPNGTGQGTIAQKVTDTFY